MLAGQPDGGLVEPLGVQLSIIHASDLGRNQRGPASKGFGAVLRPDFHLRLMSQECSEVDGSVIKGGTVVLSGARKRCVEMKLA